MNNSRVPNRPPKASLPLWNPQRQMRQTHRSAHAEEFPGRLDARRLGGTVYQLRLERGWNLDRLAREAGVSRTTVYGLECGTISRPRAITLRRIADALCITPEALQTRLCIESTTAVGQLPIDQPCDSMQSPSVHASAGPVERNAPTCATASDFDRRTNPRVDEVARHAPDLFTGWSPAEWDQLCSCFGVGGGLNEAGVRIEAERINRQRDLTFKLQLLLQTHLAERAAEFVNRLYAEVSGFSEAFRENSVSNDRVSPPSDEVASGY